MTWKKPANQVTEHRDAMQEFADKIVEQLELGVKPWVRPWDPDKCAGPQAPFNGATGDHYHGINTLILSMHPAAFQTADPRFCTCQQAKQKGWQVKVAEKSTTIFFYKPLEIEDEKAKDCTRIVPILKHFAVFHCRKSMACPPTSLLPSRMLRGRGWKPPTSS